MAYTQTQILVRVGVVLVVLLGVASVVGIASADMVPGVDEHHDHFGEQASHFGEQASHFGELFHDHVGEHTHGWMGHAYNDSHGTHEITGDAVDSHHNRHSQQGHTTHAGGR